MSSTLRKKREPEIVIEVVLNRAKVGKIGRILKTRLAFAQFKLARGWEDLSIDAIEPKIEELRKQAKPKANGHFISDSSSSSSTSEGVNRHSSYYMSSPTEGPAIFSDRIHYPSGWDSSSSSDRSGGSRKRSYHDTFDHSYFNIYPKKRYCSSPPSSNGKCCGINSSREVCRNRQLTQSSPVKSRRQTHFTTTSGPSLSFNASSYFARHSFDRKNQISDDDEDSLPIYSFSINSSPPRTPPPIWYRSILGYGNECRKEKTVGRGVDLLPHPVDSPSPVAPTRRRIPPSTPPPRSLALPSSMMFTPRGSGDLLSKFGGPHTPPSQTPFDFSDYLNMTPSSAQPAFVTSPKANRTPGTLDLRLLDLDTITSPQTYDRLSSTITPE